MLPALVLCGGRGTRLAEVTQGAMPKAMVAVAGRPFIDYKLQSLVSSGLRDVVLSIGVGGAQIRDHVGDGSRFGVTARYVDDGPHLLGTGGAVNAALGDLPGAFWVTYGDSLVTVDVPQAEARFRASGQLGLMTVLHNAGRWAPSNARVRDDLVVEYAKQPPPRGAQHIDYGMLILTAEAFADERDKRAFDLAQVLTRLATTGTLAAFEVDDRFYDIGTPEALQVTEGYLTNRQHDPRGMSRGPAN